MEHKLKILVVEDKPLIAENLKLTLEDLGYEVAHLCYTFTQAVSAISSGTIDLALLDIHLGSKNPDENGIALGQLIQKTSGTPFIFLTAYSDLETIRTATQLGPSGYLIKPVNPATVFAAVQSAIQNNLNARKAVAEEEAPDYFFLKLGDKNHRIMWNEIYCIEAGKNYVKLQVAGGQMEYPIRGSMTFVLEELLPKHLEKQFIRISRSESLNLKHITAYNTHTIIAEGREFLNTRYTLKELQELMRTVI
jgi:DNA-binding LytR/AlgR family response regulator